MRARIRTIKPEAALDEDLWDLGVTTGLPVFQAFTMLWCQADREGRFEWRPRALKAACLPYWDGDFSRVLDALVTRGFLVKYASQGREFGLVRTFKDHQSINNKEPPSRLPPPPDSVAEPNTSRVVDALLTREERVPDATIPSVPFPSRSVPDPGGGAGGTAGPPSNLEEAMALPVVDRARAVERHHLGDWLQPERWPEVVQVGEAWGARELGPYGRDSGVRAAVTCFAAGFTLERLLTAIPRIRGSDWARGKKLGMASMGIEAVRRALDESQKPDDGLTREERIELKFAEAKQRKRDEIRAARRQDAVSKS